MLESASEVAEVTPDLDSSLADEPVEDDEILVEVPMSLDLTALAALEQVAVEFLFWRQP